MSLYPLVETLVIGVAILVSGDQALRHLAPRTHRAARRWIAARLLGREIADAPAEAGCDSGCGTCATGCASDAAESPPADAAEQPLQFVRRPPST